VSSCHTLVTPDAWVAASRIRSVLRGCLSRVDAGPARGRAHPASERWCGCDKWGAHLVGPRRACSAAGLRAPGPALCSVSHPHQAQDLTKRPRWLVVSAAGGAGGSPVCAPGCEPAVRSWAACNARRLIAQSMDVSLTGSKRAPTASSEFAVVYRECVGLITAYFARRCTEPQVVADLVSETFVEAVGSFGTFDPSRGSASGWLIAIARRVFARWCEGLSGNRAAIEQLGGRLVLDADETDELAERIDAQRQGRELLARCALLPALEREALELVDLAGLEPRDAARVLGVPAGTLRVRLHRARARLRKEVRDEHL